MHESVDRLPALSHPRHRTRCGESASPGRLQHRLTSPSHRSWCTWGWAGALAPCPSSVRASTLRLSGSSPPISGAVLPVAVPNALKRPRRESVVRRIALLLSTTGPARSARGARRRRRRPRARRSGWARRRASRARSSLCIRPLSAESCPAAAFRPGVPSAATWSDHATHASIGGLQGE